MKIRCKITCIDSNYIRSKQKFIEKTSQNCLFYLISLLFFFFLSLFFRFYSFSFIISKSLITFNVRWSFVLVYRLRSRQWANMEKKERRNRQHDYFFFMLFNAVNIHLKVYLAVFLPYLYVVSISPCDKSIFFPIAFRRREEKNEFRKPLEIQIYSEMECPFSNVSEGNVHHFVFIVAWKKIFQSQSR